MINDVVRAKRVVAKKATVGDPFLRRLDDIITTWVANEWETKEAIRCEAMALGWKKPLVLRFKEASLTPTSLAHCVDNMSLTKLRRELAKLDAPPPGELIRRARIAHAAQLLTHTRLMIKQVAERCGYRSEKHFTDAFKATFAVPPSDFRRTFITHP